MGASYFVDKNLSLHCGLPSTIEMVTELEAPRLCSGPFWNISTSSQMRKFTGSWGSLNSPPVA